MWARRALFPAAALALLGACGFRPLYGPDGEAVRLDTSDDPRLVQAMAAVRVANIPERRGQLMRRALQRRFEDSRPGTPIRYDLQVRVNFQAEALGFRRDGTASRVRFLASAPWSLTDGAPTPIVLGRGLARTLDSYTVPDGAFFAAEASRDDTERRLIEELADRVAIGVAATLRRRLAAG